MKAMLRAAALAACLLPALAWAADDKDTPKIDKKAAELVKKVGALYKDAKSLHTDATIDTTVEREGKDKREVKVKATIDLERPNHFALRTKLGDDANAGATVVCDGKSLYALARRLKQYTEIKAPSGMTGV